MGKSQAQSIRLVFRVVRGAEIFGCLSTVTCTPASKGLAVSETLMKPSNQLIAQLRLGEYRISDRQHPVMLGSYDYSKKVCVYLLSRPSGVLQQSPAKLTEVILSPQLFHPVSPA